MKLHDLKPHPGSTRKKTRVGRGIAAGKGRYAGRGIKGAGARAGKGIPHYFEGGQLPLVRRLPFKRGFTNIFRIEYQEVHLSDLNELFEAGAAVTPAAMAEQGLIRNAMRPVVILGNGDIAKALTISAHRFTKSAADRIAAAGGTVQKLELLVTGARATVKKMRKSDLAELADKS
jgi:large subunit ribosomal protein L15